MAGKRLEGVNGGFVSESNFFLLALRNWSSRWRFSRSDVVQDEEYDDEFHFEKEEDERKCGSECC